MVKILLVEDNEMNRDMLGRRLMRKGFEIDVAGNGLEAIEQANAGMPDLIVMDMNMPEMDGWEATRRIRAQEATSGIPIIAFTACALAEDREACLAAGCDDYETKPVDFKSLCDKIDNLLKRADNA